MKRGLFVGVTVACLLCSYASLRAQPVSAPVPTADETTQAGSDPAHDNETVVVNDDPDRPWVQGVPLESRVAARELFLEGYRLAELSAYRGAADKFTAALAQWKHPSFYFNLGLAQLHLGQEVEARENLVNALKYGEAPLGAEYFREAQKRLQDLSRQLGRLRVTCRTPGAAVTLDGVTIFIGPGTHERWTRAKSYELTAKKAGYQSEARRVVVSAGELLDVDLSLVTLTQAADISRRWASWKPWAVMASGALTVAAGGVLHGFAFRNFDKFDAEVVAICPSKGCLEGEVNSHILNQARRHQEYAIGGYIVGGSLIITGALLLYMNRPGLTTQERQRLPYPKVSVYPSVTADILGVFVGLSR